MSTKKVPEEINIAVKQLNDKIEETKNLESVVLVSRGSYLTKAIHAKPATLVAFICHMIEDAAAATNAPVDVVLKFVRDALDNAAEEE